MKEIDFRLPRTIVVVGDVCKIDGVGIDVGDIDENMGSRSAVVSIVTRPRAGWFGVQLPLGLKHFSSFQHSQSGSGPTHPPLKWEPVFFFSGLRRPSFEVNHSPPFRPEVKKEWSFAFTHPSSTAIVWTRATLLFYFSCVIMFCLLFLWV